MRPGWTRLNVVITIVRVLVWLYDGTLQRRLLGSTSFFAVEFALLGKPTSLQTSDDHTTFGWHASRVEIRNESSPYSVSAHLSPAMYPSIANASHEYYCDLTLTVDAADRIAQWNHDGNRDGCRSMASY